MTIVTIVDLSSFFFFIEITQNVKTKRERKKKKA